MWPYLRDLMHRLSEHTAINHQSIGVLVSALQGYFLILFTHFFTMELFIKGCVRIVVKAYMLQDMIYCKAPKNDLTYPQQTISKIYFPKEIWHFVTFK